MINLYKETLKYKFISHSQMNLSWRISYGTGEMAGSGTVVPGFSVLYPSPQKGALNPGSALNPGKSIK